MRLKCFHCEQWFSSVDTPEEEADDPHGTICEICEWHQCPYCDGCYCGLSEEGQRVARAMQEQYQLLLGGLLGAAE